MNNMTQHNRALAEADRIALAAKLDAIIDGRALFYSTVVPPNLRACEVGNPFPDDVAYITLTIAQATFCEGFCKHLLLMHGLSQYDLKGELAALQKTAQIRVKSVKEEADALVDVDYERDRRADVNYFVTDCKPRMTLNVSTALPDINMEEPFFSQDKHLNDIRGWLIEFYVKNITNFNLLLKLEAKGFLSDSAEQVYLTAVDTGNDKLRQELERLVIVNWEPSIVDSLF